MELYNSINLYSVIAFIIKIFILGTFIFYLYPNQLKEIFRPKDWLTKLRWAIFGIIIFFIVSLLPSLIYQFLRMTGVESEFLQNVVSVTTNISLLSVTVLLIFIFRYRKKDDS